MRFNIPRAIAKLRRCGRGFLLAAPLLLGYAVPAIAADSVSTPDTTTRIADEIKSKTEQINIRGSLTVLDKYKFLYDDRIATKGDIAAAYNNRCYAYMELGELQNALEDCNRSL